MNSALPIKLPARIGPGTIRTYTPCSQLFSDSLMTT